MRGKILFVAGAAVGYVLGTRAGRKRYEQIKAAADRVWQTPAVQRQVQQAEDYAARKIGEIPGAVFDGVARAVGSAVQRAAGGKRTDAGARAAVTGTSSAGGAGAEHDSESGGGAGAGTASDSGETPASSGD